MTPPFASGSLVPSPGCPSRRVRAGRSWAIAGLAAAALVCPAGAQSPGTGDRVPAAVDRHTLSKGTELWVARVPHAGPAGVSLVFPGGVASEVRELARQVGAGCPGPAPVLGAGPDYEILSLSRRPEDVPEALDCLGSVLREIGAGAEALPPASTDPAGRTYASEVEATRSATGVLLTTLYAPAPVPGGTLGIAGPGPTAPAPSHVVVAGAVDSRSVIRRAEGGIGAAAVAPAGERRAREGDSTATPSPRPPVTTEVLVLDRPGEATVDVRVGQLILAAEDPDWVALVAAREILADRLRDGPWAFAELLRVRGPGAFVAGGRVPLDALPAALDRLWSELEALRGRLVGPDELRAATGRLARSFEAETSDAPALADELARVAALGLGPEAVRGYTFRLEALTAEALRRAVREHLDPGRLVIAAAGDGPALAAELGRFGPVRRIETPEPPTDWPLPTVDGRVLDPGVHLYRVRIGDRTVGTARRELERADGGRIRLRSTARVGEEELVQEADATLPGLLFLEEVTRRGDGVETSLRREGDRLRGTAPGGMPVDLSIPPGTVVSDLLEPTLWASTLEVGANYRLPVATPDGARVVWAAVQVVAEEEVAVPAGNVRTLRVRVSGPELLTLWLRREPPHWTVRLLGANGVVLELETEDAGGR